MGYQVIERIVLGWQLASFDDRDRLLLQTFEAVYIHDDRFEFHFRKGLFHPLTVRYELPTERGEERDAFEAAGFGRRPSSPALTPKWLA